MRDCVERPDWFDMQGLLLSAYPNRDQAQYLLYNIDPLRIADARNWLRRLLPDVTPASKYTHANRPRNVNIALTATGLAKLATPAPNPAFDQPDVEAIAAALPEFSAAFIEGVAGNASRSRILGHTGDNAPGTWTWGGPKTPVVDVLLMVFADADRSLAKELHDFQPPPGLTPAGNLKETLRLSAAQKHEHFGFMDGISQPILVGTDDAERYPESSHLTALGEFVFGYKDGSDTKTFAPPLGGHERFGQNGSYLVLSQMEQDVEEFRKFAHDHTQRNGQADPAAAMELASKIIGRQPDGTPLVPHGNRDDNEFGFTEDPYGYGCPIGSHIRRANPRDSFLNTNHLVPYPITLNRHRILRRGRSYGDRYDPKGDNRDESRGLYFMCLNSDIERQFEFIQQNWINNSGFFGLSGERDPLIGDRTAIAHAHGTLTVPAVPAPACVGNLQRFVTVRGAQYFFLPGLRALEHLAGVR